jgi:hypothetical protein
MSNLGRPRVFDEKKRNTILTLVGIGFGLRDAARYAGCSVNTVRREMRRDEKLAQEVQSAEIKAQIGAVQKLREASSTHWRAAAWYLERTNPRRFARPSVRAFNSDEIQAVFDDVVSAAAEEIDDPELRARVCRRLLLAGAYAARALDSDPTRRVDPRSVIPDRRAKEIRQIDRMLEEFDKECEQRRRHALSTKSQTQKSPADSAPSANGAKAKPAA